MAELASPESWCTGNGTVGSNPTPSATGRPHDPTEIPRRSLPLRSAARAGAEAAPAARAEAVPAAAAAAAG